MNFNREPLNGEIVVEVGLVSFGLEHRRENIGVLCITPIENADDCGFLVEGF
jgi:hypothetical protein